MFTIVADLAVLAVVGYCGVLGYSRGMRPALVIALELFFALALGMLLVEPLAGLLTPLLEGIGGRDLDAEAWSMLFAFLLAFGGTFAALQALVPKTLVSPAEDDNAFADELQLTQAQQIGGAIMGASAGVLVVGIALIVLSMLPLPVEYRFRTSSMLYDVGAFCLRGIGHVADLGVGGRSVLAFGEPTSTAQEPTAKLSSESYTDLDGDNKCTESDSHLDLDDSGTYSPDLYYLDLDEDNARRVGWLEKYVTAQWGTNPKVMNRPRPGAQPARQEPTPGEGEEGQENLPPPPAATPPSSATDPNASDEETAPPAPPAGDDF